VSKREFVMRLKKPGNKRLPAEELLVQMVKPAYPTHSLIKF